MYYIARTHLHIYMDCSPINIILTLFGTYEYFITHGQYIYHKLIKRV